jgi:hypothetical protein
MIDTLVLFRKIYNVPAFGTTEKRMKNLKLASFGRLFGLGEETHRALDDVRMNIEVLKRCCTQVFNFVIMPFFRLY